MKKTVGDPRKYTCRWMPGTRRSVCDRTDRKMVPPFDFADPTSHPEMTCPDCRYIESEQTRLHSERLTDSWEIRDTFDDEKAYSAWAYEVRPGIRKRWLLALQSWSPNYGGAWVKAYVCPSWEGWMIAIHGGDDVSCNQFFPDRESAMKVWDRIPELLSMQSCVDLGFQF